MSGQRILGRVTRLERSLNYRGCALCGSVAPVRVLVRGLESVPDDDESRARPCPRCGREPMVIWIVADDELLAQELAK